MTAPTIAEQLAQRQVQQVPIKALAQAIVARSDELGLTWRLRFATVSTYATDGSLRIVYDNDTEPVPATPLIGGLAVGTRVTCLITPPGGNHVIGLIGSQGFLVPGQQLMIAKIADAPPINNNATFQADNELVKRVAAGLYGFEMECFFNSNATADFKSQFSLSAGTIGPCSFISSTPTGYATTNANGLVVGIPGNSTDLPFTTRGTFTATADNALFSWERAQNTATVADTFVRAGSWLKLWRIS